MEYNSLLRESRHRFDGIVLAARPSRWYSSDTSFECPTRPRMTTYLRYPHERCSSKWCLLLGFKRQQSNAKSAQVPELFTVEWAAGDLTKQQSNLLANRFRQIHSRKWATFRANLVRNHSCLRWPPSRKYLGSSTLSCCVPSSVPYIFVVHIQPYSRLHFLCRWCFYQPVPTCGLS